MDSTALTRRLTGDFAFDTMKEGAALAGINIGSNVVRRRRQSLPGESSTFILKNQVN